MRQIEIGDGTYSKLEFGARVAGLTISELVDRLVDAPISPTVTDAKSGGPTAAVSVTPHEVAVFVDYQGQHVEGFLDVGTDRLRITDGPSSLVGRSFKSPTQAAVAVVKVVNPGRARPETNGWKFWRDPVTDKIIHLVHRTRMSL